MLILLRFSEAWLQIGCRNVLPVLLYYAFNECRREICGICYVDFEAQDKIFLVMVFAKNKMENLSPSERNSIKAYNATNATKRQSG